MVATVEPIPTKFIQSRVFELWSLRVLLGADLAAIHEVPTKRLVEWTTIIEAIRECAVPVDSPNSRKVNYYSNR